LGLRQVFVFSVFSGISFAFTFRISGDASEVGIVFLVLNFLSQNTDPRIQGLIMIVSLVITIFFIYGLAVFFRKIYEQKLAGVVTALLGFAGSLLVFLSSQANTHLIVLGIGVWISGIFVVSFFERKSSIV